MYQFFNGDKTISVYDASAQFNYSVSNAMTHYETTNDDRKVVRVYAKRKHNEMINLIYILILYFLINNYFFPKKK